MLASYRKAPGNSRLWRCLSIACEPRRSDVGDGSLNLVRRMNGFPAQDFPRLPSGNGHEGSQRPQDVVAPELPMIPGIPGIPGMLVHSARFYGIGEETPLAINAV